MKRTQFRPEIKRQGQPYVDRIITLRTRPPTLVQNAVVLAVGRQETVIPASVVFLPAKQPVGLELLPELALGFKRQPLRWRKGEKK